MENPQDLPVATHKSGIYWRRSYFFAWRCPPGILALVDGRLSFTTAKGVVFDAPAHRVGVAFSRVGTLTLTVEGTAFRFVGTAGDLSTPFSPEQRAELAAVTVSPPGDGLRAAGSAGVAFADTVAGLGGDISGFADSYGSYTSGIRVLQDWPPLLRSLGAKVDAKKPVALVWAVRIGVGVFAAIVLGAVIVGVVQGFTS
jgi:hypothetical protein